MVYEQIFFDQPVKNNFRTYHNIWEIDTSQEDDYTTVCLLEYNYTNHYYKMIPIDLSKRQALDVDPKAIQKLIFLKIYILKAIKVNINDNTTMLFITEEAKETVLDFSWVTVKVLRIFFFYFNIVSL